MKTAIQFAKAITNLAVWGVGGYIIGRCLGYILLRLHG